MPDGPQTEQFTPAQLSDGTILHFKGVLTPDQVRDKVAEFRYRQSAATSQPGDPNYAIKQARAQLHANVQPVPPDSLGEASAAPRAKGTPVDAISSGLDRMIQKSDRSALQQANATGEAPEGQVWGSYGPRMLKTAVDYGRSMVQHPLLTAGVIAANTNPVTAVPVDAALFAHGSATAYKNRQALKDFVTTGNANPDQLEAGLGGMSEASGGLAGVKGNLAPARAALRPSIQEQNVAAQKALAPSPRHAEAFQRDLEGARPYLGGRGIKSQTELKAAIPGAENEIWKPYADALERFGNESVQGPEGPTTYNALEARRVELSNQLSSLNQKDPVAAQTIIAQGKTPAQLLDEQSAIEGLLDERMRLEGINSPLLRRTIGNVKGIERQVSGRNTLTEEPQRYGLGKMAQQADFNIFRPFKSARQTLQGVAAGAKDIAAGRPWWSGKPTDVGIAEGLQSGAPKPTFQTTTARAPFGPALAPPVSGPPPSVEPQFRMEGTGRPTNATGRTISIGRRVTGDVNVLPTEHFGEGDYAGLLPGPPAPFVPPPPGPPVPQVGQPPSLGFPPTMPDVMWTGRATPAAPTWALPAENQPFTTPSGQVAPSTPPVVPSSAGGTPPTGNAPAPPPTSAAPPSSSVPPTLPPLPEPAPINPQEVADLQAQTPRVISADRVNQFLRDRATEQNIAEGLAGRRQDTAGQIREAHRAQLQKHYSKTKR